MKVLQMLLVFILVLFVTESIGAFFKKQDQIRSTIGYLRSCGSEEDNRLKLNLHTYKYNRTHLATSMNITFNEPFGLQYMIDMELMLWGDGGWKRNFFRYKKSNACNTLYKILGPVWVDVITTAGASRDCPLPAGFYQFKDHYIDLSQLPFISTPGRFLMMAIVSKRNIKQVCIEIELELKVLMRTT